jgi:hypothetical protein
MSTGPICSISSLNSAQGLSFWGGRAFASAFPAHTNGEMRAARKASPVPQRLPRPKCRQRQGDGEPRAHVYDARGLGSFVLTATALPWVGVRESVAAAAA